MWEKLELKVPPPFIALLAAGGAYLVYRLIPSLNFAFPAQNWLAGLLVCGGLTFDALAIFKFFQNKTTISPLSPEKTERLVMEGVYARTRNPMYLGLVFLLTALGVRFGNPLSLIAIPLFVFLVTRLQIVPEERILRQRFPETYEKWSKSVPRWI